jgi:dTDP-4-dehydrorhamnose 3,5-epimerase-like enzyme
MLIEDCRFIELPTIRDDRGALTFIEAQRQVPFAIKRVFYIVEAGRGVTRGGHAHRQFEQVLICLSGQLWRLVDDGLNSGRYVLSSPSAACTYHPTGVQISPVRQGGAVEMAGMAGFRH